MVFPVTCGAGLFYCHYNEQNVVLWPKLTGPKLRGVEVCHVRNRFIPFLLSGNVEEAKVIAHQVLSLLGVPN
jgi:hypothetical protein